MVALSISLERIGRGPPLTSSSRKLRDSPSSAWPTRARLLGSGPSTLCTIRNACCIYESMVRPGGSPRLHSQRDRGDQACPRLRTCPHRRRSHTVRASHHRVAGQL